MSLSRFYPRTQKPTSNVRSLDDLEQEAHDCNARNHSYAYADQHQARHATLYAPELATEILRGVRHARAATAQKLTIAYPKARAIQAIVSRRIATSREGIDWWHCHGYHAPLGERDHEDCCGAPDALPDEDARSRWRR